MASGTAPLLLRHLRHWAGTVNAAVLTDRELLRRFVEQRDETAFATLMHRHAGMVLGVCRRVVRQQQDAEDACQATFLLLARKAGSQRWRDSVGNWLYTAAYQLALKARTASGRRRKREQTVAAQTPTTTLQQMNAAELLAALDEELARLPEKFRAPLVLCHLEGATRDEAARQLGCPLATLKSRLEKGKSLLHAALVRRGLTLSAGLAALLWAEAASHAAVSVAMLQRTTQAAVMTAAGKPIGEFVTQCVTNLLHEGSRTMFLTKAKLSLALAALLLSTVLGSGLLTDAAAQGNHLTPRNRSLLPLQGNEADGGGISDYQKVHKYRMAADQPGDWQQRREFTYSVRAVIRVMRPYNLKALNDDYQDVRLLKETPEYAELEVTLYPYNTNAQTIKGNPNWQKDYAGMREYLAPGITTNWDEAMRQNLLRELAADGIDPDKLTDKEVVEQVSRWLFQHSKYRYMFCTFYISFRDGKAEVLPGLKQAFEREKGDKTWTVQQQLEHELFGKEMFARKVHGTCTSTAVYQATVLRALGIPTRMVLCIPVADASDPAQVAMAEKNLKHNRVRRDVYLGLRSVGSGFTSHTFCEVFVDGRWRRLNHTRLGQNILDINCLGLMVHVHTFNDLSDANLAATWGTRYATSQRDDLFPYNNPYRLLEINDHFGAKAKVENPPLGELKTVTLGKAYWADAPDAPEALPESLRRQPNDGSGRLFLHGEEWLANGDNYFQYKVFLQRASQGFILQAKGHPDLHVRLSGLYITSPAEGVREMEVIIPKEEFAKMAKGVTYTIHPVNGKAEYIWKVRDGLTVKRP